MSSAPTIVITGLGAVCGAGRTPEEIFGAITAGRSAVGPITQFDATGWPVRIAAECNLENKVLVPDRKLHKSISRTDMYGIYAADQAVEQSGLAAFRAKLDPALVPGFNDRSGIISGSGGGTYQSSYDYLPLVTVAKGQLHEFGLELGNTVNPMWLLRNLPNNVLCHAGIRHNFKGANTTITNQCAGGIMAVAESAAAIQAGEADRMTAIGHDAPYEPETVYHYHQLGLLADDALRPFDGDRRGTVFGEGGAALVLEKADDARARGANILGEFLGSGCVTEATGILDVRSDGEGVASAARLALADAGMGPADIGMVVAHGNGTRASDASEAKGIRRIFGDNPPPITGFKWACGHLIAAAGILDLVLAICALRQGVVPGIATLRAPDAEFGGLPLSAGPQKPRGNTALVICRGFGGMNVAAVVRVQP